MRRIPFVSIVAMLLAVAPASAADRWSFELRGGAALPTSEVQGADLGTGLGVAGTLSYRFLPHLSSYAGWDWHQFSPDASIAGEDADFVETGYAFGLRFEHPFVGEFGAGPAFWARTGVTYAHIEIEDADGRVIEDSEHGLGWEASAGVTLPIAARWRMTPGVRYRDLSREMTLGGTKTDVELRHVGIELGVSYLF